MPVFEYVCRDCGKKFESLDLSGKAGKEKCPACGSLKTEKKLSSFACSVGTGSKKAPSCGSGRCCC